MLDWLMAVPDVAEPIFRIAADFENHEQRPAATIVKGFISKILNDLETAIKAGGRGKIIEREGGIWDQLKPHVRIDITKDVSACLACLATDAAVEASLMPSDWFSLLEIPNFRNPARFRVAASDFWFRWIVCPTCHRKRRKGK